MKWRGMVLPLIVIGTLNLAWPAAAAEHCAEDVCIDINFPPNSLVFTIPPQCVPYLIILPDVPSDTASVCVQLYRLNQNGQAEMVFQKLYKMHKENVREIKEKFPKIRVKKSGSFILAVSLAGTEPTDAIADLEEWAEESKTVSFDIKWKKETGGSENVPADRDSLDSDGGGTHGTPPN